MNFIKSWLGFLMPQFGGGGGGTTSTNTIQNADPWVGVQPYLSQGLQAASNLYNQGAPSYYPGNTVAGMSPWTRQALLDQANIAGTANIGVENANQNIADTLAGKYLNADTNPYLKGAVDTALNDVQTRTNSQFKADNYGGSAHQEWLSRNLADRALPIYAENYANERNKQMAAASMAPSLNQAQFYNPSQLAQAGTAVSNYEQQLINEQINRYNYNTQGPANWLNQFLSQVTGSNLGGTKTGTSTSPYYTNPISQAMGIGMGGLSMYNAANQAGLFGSGAAGGAANAALLGGSGGFTAGLGAAELAALAVPAVAAETGIPITAALAAMAL